METLKLANGSVNVLPGRYLISDGAFSRVCADGLSRLPGGEKPSGVWDGRDGWIEIVVQLAVRCALQTVSDKPPADCMWNGDQRGARSGAGSPVFLEPYDRDHAQANWRT